MIQNTVLWFDVSMEYSLLMEIHDSKEGLGEVVTREGFGKTADSACTNDTYIYSKCRDYEY